jgi:AraC family transcriptional regulator, transcriptional activator FtrA
MDHRVAALVFDGLAPFELGVVIEVFGLNRPELNA